MTQYTPEQARHIAGCMERGAEMRNMGAPALRSLADQLEQALSHPESIPADSGVIAATVDHVNAAVEMVAGAHPDKGTSAFAAPVVPPPAVCRNCIGFGWEPSMSGRVPCGHCTAPVVPAPGVQGGESINPYPSGSVREGWQRGYEGRPMLADRRSDYGLAYKEGARTRVAQPPQQSAQPAAANDKYSDLLSMAIGVIMGQRAKIGYTDNSPIAKVVAEAVEHLKDWPFPAAAQPVEVQQVYSWAIPQGETYAEVDTGKFTMEMLVARDKKDPEYDPTNKHFVYGFHAASPTARLRGYRDGLAAAQPVESVNGWEKGLEIRMSQGWKLKGGICPVLYSDTVNGYGVGRDDLWLATTDALKAAQPVEVQRVPADPMDWPLPCDVTVGHGTMRKGVSLRTLVLRMKTLYKMATGNDADEVAARTPDLKQVAEFQEMLRNSRPTSSEGGVK